MVTNYLTDAGIKLLFTISTAQASFHATFGSYEAESQACGLPSSGCVGDDVSCDKHPEHVHFEEHISGHLKIF